ncbi:hypothetical protein L2E82_39296 [Cichorium intybus]|uniref:Uncharacterized protein n=1 Tax=Cichorium intybus TaxID=13427 RepID=A0ACB9AHL6_CICIN|nr:hypothetical protein L2E82_39296 [Cichorium intybus]
MGTKSDENHIVEEDDVADMAETHVAVAQEKQSDDNRIDFDWWRSAQSNRTIKEEKIKPWKLEEQIKPQLIKD